MNYEARQRARRPVPELICEYCMVPIETAFCQDGFPKLVQPRACSKAHRERVTAWDRWVVTGREVRRPGPRLPSMPKAEVVAPFRMNEERRAA